jgi:hypothetical protein
MGREPDPGRGLPLPPERRGVHEDPDHGGREIRVALDGKEGGRMKRIGLSLLVLVVLAGITQAWTFRPANLDVKAVGGDYDPVGRAPRTVYPGFTNSPGESIDFTYYDFQASGSVSRQIAIDGIRNGGLHVAYMKSPNNTHTPRNAAYQFNDRAGSGWSGEMDMNTFRAGYVTLATMSDGRAVGAFHQAGGPGNQTVVAVDAARGAGAFTVTPLDTGPFVSPHVAVGPTDVIHVVAHHQTRSDNYYCRSTNQGASFTPWVPVAGDTNQNPISYDVITSRASGKVAIAWTRFVPGGIHRQLDMDVVYVESTNHGLTWGPRVNVTNYQSADTVRAYNDVSGVFDQSDNLHLVWGGHRQVRDTIYYAGAAFHWNQATGIDCISGLGTVSGTWWWSLTGLPATWSLDVTRPSLSIDGAGNLYCVFSSQRNDDDTSAAGYINMDLYGTGSRDGGNIWSPVFNITNSHTPGGAAGACDDDRFPSLTAFTTDSVRVLWIVDRDAGASVQNEGTTTLNPIHYWSRPKSMFLGVVEEKASIPSTVSHFPFSVHPNPFASLARVPGHVTENFELYDISGRRIGIYRGDRIGQDLGPGVYFLKLEHGHAKPFRIVKVK